MIKEGTQRINDVYSLGEHDTEYMFRNL